MRHAVVLVICALIALVTAWSKEDYEIFSLRDEVALSEGPEVTFYDFVGVKASASQIDVNKALKKKSRTLHPDKVKQQFIATRSRGEPPKRGEKKPPGVRVSKGPSDREVKNAYNQANERYARLVLVAKVLQGENRERYDYFMANGFPKWRGSGYYYARFRPGLGTVLVGLFIVMGGAAHYGALVLGWKRQRSFIEKYIRHARKTAWGDETGIRGIPGVDGAPAGVAAAAQESDSTMQMNRRQKRQLGKESRKDKSTKGKPSGQSSAPSTAGAEAGPQGEKKRVVADNGKVLIVDSSGNVYLEQEDEDGKPGNFLLDLDEIPKPTIKDTALVKLPVWIFHKATGRFRKGNPSSESHDQAEVFIGDLNQDQDQDPGAGFEVIGNDSPVDTMAQANGNAKRRNKKTRN